MEDVWGLGDYDRVAFRTRPAARALVAEAGVYPGQTVVDLAAGTGNVAVAAARLGAAVTALDGSAALVERGRVATAAAGLEVEWGVGDFNRVDRPDGSFDAVLSAFGLIYAADADAALTEAFRLCAADGVVGVATWADGGFQHEASVVLGDVLGAPAPSSPWGSPDALRSLFGRHASTLRTVDVRFDWCFDSPEQWLDQAMQVAPPLVALQQKVDAAVLSQAREALLGVARRFASDGVIPQHALVAVAAKR